jgi:succinyl-CoA synthetase beta subunit
VAQAILDAFGNNLISVPVYARISGAESEKAKEMLSGSRAELYNTVEEAIQAAVAEARRG